MKREQMIEKLTAVLPYHQRINPPGGECSCGHVTPLGQSTCRHVAEVAVNAIFPQASEPYRCDR